MATDPVSLLEARDSPPSPDSGDGDDLVSRVKAIAEGMRRTMVDPDLERRLVALSRDNINEYGFDRFGYAPAYIRRVLPIAAVVYKYWFRTRTYGIENVPATGPVMLIANHSGQLPFDGAMIAIANLLDSEPPRMVRAMVEKWVPTLPFASVFMARCGQVVGTPENCRALLQDGEAILVFPEGSAGISKTFDKRYQLQKFGYGFMRLAVESGTPIVPVAVIGAEEQAPALYNWRALAKILGSPAVPITPTFPLLGPLGLLPYPVRYHLHFGAPMWFDGHRSDDDGTVGRQVKSVKTALRDLIEHGLRARPGVFI